MSKLRIYFSGGTGLVATPEGLVPKLKPRIMLTFYDIRKSGTKSRFQAYLKNHHANKTRKNQRRITGNQTGRAYK